MLQHPLLILLLCVLPTASCRQSAAPTRPRAAGGELLPAAAEATATVVGSVGHVARIDRHAYRAPLLVEESLAGDFGKDVALEMAWEELAAEREPRFRTGDRILVALVPLPSGSLWMNRFPPPLRKDSLLSVAAGGEAFLRAADAATVAALAEYLAVAAEQRRSAAAVPALSRLASEAAAPLARSAVGELAGLPGLAIAADAPAANLLRSAIADATRPHEVRLSLLRLAAQHRLAALRPAVEALSTGNSPLRADAVEALAAIDQGLSSEEILALLNSQDETLRRAAVRAASGALVDDRVSVLLRDDPSPLVRSAAVQALAAGRGRAALGRILEALADQEPQVRDAAATAVGKLGADVAAEVEHFGMSGSAAAAHGTILALVELGPAGTDGLRRMSTQHSDTQVRQLASLALGRPRSDH